MALKANHISLQPLPERRELVMSVTQSGLSTVHIVIDARKFLEIARVMIREFSLMYDGELHAKERFCLLLANECMDDLRRVL